MFTQQDEWRKSFENKTESELDATEPPPGLTKDMAERWGYERAEALVRSLKTRAEAEDAQIAQEKSALESALTALENETPEVPAARRGMAAPSLLEIPRGNVADLLEQQIATCAALIGNVANFVAHSETPPHECFPMMDRIASLLSSSATAARVVGQLRGIANETKQTFVKKIEGEREGECRKRENKFQDVGPRGCLATKNGTTARQPQRTENRRAYQTGARSAQAGHVRAANDEAADRSREGRVSDVAMLNGFRFSFGVMARECGPPSWVLQRCAELSRRFIWQRRTNSPGRPAFAGRDIIIWNS